MTISINAFSRALALAVLASLAAACGGGDDKSAADQAPAAASPAGTTSQEPGAAAANAGAKDELANAVAVGKTAAAVDLKYDLTARPEVGQPL
jgi:hypothetical protein